MFTDFSQIFNDAEIEEREQILAEDAAANELNEIADMVEAKDLDFEFDELVENLRFTADQNPVSETAVDLKFAGIKALQELR